jgi:hypothetical protein
MARFYNQLRSLKGTSIGTILAWSGDIGSIPRGWVICNGAGLNSTDYPELFSVIGYQYGGSGQTFTLPRLQDKAIADYHPSHSNISELGLNTDFVSRMGEDIANATSGRTSNIDLFFRLEQVNNISGRITGLGINPSSYTDDVTIVPRVLGDHHYGSHSHLGESPSVIPTGEFAEDCQANYVANCSALEAPFFDFDEGCRDQCGHVEYYPSEANGNIPWSSFITPSGANSANTMGLNITSGNPFNRNSDNYNIWKNLGLFGGQITLQNSPNKNYMIPADDTVTKGANANGEYPYPVHLNHPGVNFSGTPISGSPGSQKQGVNPGVNFSFVGHDHLPMSYSITIGNIRVPNIISVNNISTGSMEPLNSSLQSIATIRMENINTPSLNIIHIIRAY